MSNAFIQQLPVILASGSAVRARLLQSLGLEFTIEPSNVDEQLIKEKSFESNIDLGFKLSDAKALKVSEYHRQSLVIGADQLCICNNQIFDKPGTKESAILQLKTLSGKLHQQVSCVSLAYQGEIIKRFHDVATLELLPLDDTIIERYIETEMPLDSCGAYQFEHLGKWLFRHVEGSESTILGLPLLLLKQALIECAIVRLAPLKQKD